jgi:hypothetical protein
MALPEDGRGDHLSDEKKKPQPKATKVLWTEKGEAAGAHSEHGKHAAGDVVETDHAALLIERGFAKAAS